MLLKKIYLHSNICDLYMLSHQKFDLKFASDDLQKRLAELVPIRLNVKCSFHCGTFFLSIQIITTQCNSCVCI